MSALKDRPPEEQGEVKTEAAALLVKEVADLWEEPRWSDLSIKCGERQWKVHKNRVCCCDFFAKACAGPWTEGRNRVINLPEDEAHVVNAMLCFMYTADYDDTAAESSEASPIFLDVLVYTIADKYGIPLLARLAQAKFSTRAEAEWSTSPFVSAVREVYNVETGTKRPLRDIVVMVCVQYAQSLLAPDNENQADHSEDLRVVARSIPSLGLNLATALLLHSSIGSDASEIAPNEKRYKCVSCVDTFVIRSVEETDREDFHCPYCGTGAGYSTWRDERMIE